MENFKVNIKIKLLSLWASLMFCFAYADILAHMRSDIVGGIIAGELEGIRITQETLIGSAVLMIIPILMIVLSVTLKGKINRWTNIIVGISYTIVNLSTVIMAGGTWIYYYVFAAAEVLITILIVLLAWKWD